MMLLLAVSGNIAVLVGQESCFVFYNVENLFDPADDPDADDSEFTPDGDKHWNYDRYMAKIDHIARVLVGIGQWQLPGIVGLCEVENRGVLQELAGHRLLREFDYKILHMDSPDRRGIDVALLYKPGIFDPVATQWLRMRFMSDTSLRSRDILYAKGLMFGADTIHIFINHWPSRYGGAEASMPKRFETAWKLRQVTDSVFGRDHNSNILIAGDFNDSPADPSVLNVLGAQMLKDGHQKGPGLYNLMTAFHDDKAVGTLKYKADWDVFDQIIVSAGLAGGKSGIFMKDGAKIYDPEFLLEEDERYLGMKPFRTYAGPNYLGGFSDHLPVYLLLYKEKIPEKE